MLPNNPLLKILYEDDFLFIVEKPSGITVDNSETTKEGEITVEDLLGGLRVERGLLSEIDRNGIVHRLDKETSGVLVVAKDSETKDLLQKEFAERRVKKTYIAVVNGSFQEGLVSVDAPIARNPKVKVKFAIVQGGREAYTEFKKIKEVELFDREGEGHKFSMVECRPQTGRTHQIRVHLLGLGFPIASDNLYLNERTILMNRTFFHRLMLHAVRIEFTNPRTGLVVLCESKLPAEFDC